MTNSLDRFIHEAVITRSHPPTNVIKEKAKTMDELSSELHYGDVDAVILQTTAVLHIPGSAVPVDTTFMYDEQDPAAVTICFRSGSDNQIEWLLARDLLADGMSAMTGEGDVAVWPGPNESERSCNLRLTSPTGTAVFELPADHVRTFLDRTFEVVPRNCEVYGVGFEEELKLLLGERF